MSHPKMYNPRYKKVKAACHYLMSSPDAGHTEIADALKCSRATAWRVMKDAILFGWVKAEVIQWRSNATATRYQVTDRFPYA